MKIYFCLFAFILIAGTNTQGQKKSYTLEDVYKKQIFQPKNISGFASLPDGKFYSEIIVNNGVESIVKKSFKDEQYSQTLLDGTNAPKELGKIEEYTISNDEQMILLFTQSESIYRRSAKYIVYIYSIQNHSYQKINENKVLHATLSPNNKSVAYVQDNNLFIYDIQGKTTQAITTDGSTNRIINGNCDWVYEEEFGFSKAFEWSENSEYIAYYKFDESNVKEMTIQYYYELYPENYVFKYPKAGEDNSKLKLMLYSVRNQNNDEIVIPHTQEIYIPKIKWASNNTLAIITLNRLQNNLNIYFSQAQNKTIQSIYHETDPAYVDVPSDLLFLHDNSFILTSEKDGYNHIYWYTSDGNLKKQLTRGNWEVRKLIGIDPKEEYLYFTSSENSPLENQIYQCRLKNAKTNKISQEPGWHEPSFTKSMDFFLDSYSSISTPPTFVLKYNNGKSLRMLEDNSEFLKVYNSYNNSPIELSTINVNGESLNALWLKPTNFNPQHRYPVIMYQYSGPGSQSVKNSFQIQQHYLHQILVQKGYIILVVDGRGTGGRGAKFKKLTYRQLGRYESDDQIAVAQWLQSQPFIDSARIGIWGWSFGGYMSSICIMKGADLFKTAIAVAPVTNWRYYDNIYTERYMGLPVDNPQGYDDNSPTSMVDKLKGNFLIVHGLADDNVHFQNTAMLISEMVKKNKYYNSEIYPNQAHGMGSARYNLYNRIVSYFTDNL